MKRLITVACTIVVATAVASAALAEDGHDPDLMLLVSAIDIIPSRDQLVEAGSGGDGAGLIAIAGDTAQSQYTRIRAISLLAHFPSSANFDVVRLFAIDLAELDEVRIAALFAATEIAPASDAHQLNAIIISFFAEEELELQRAALRAVERADPFNRAAILDWVVDLELPLQQPVLERVQELMTGSAPPQ